MSCVEDTVFRDWKSLISRDNIDWLLSRFRPRAYVRLAFWAAVAGIALLAGPIWYPLVQALSLKTLGVPLPVVDNPLIGAVVVCASMVFFLACFAIETFQQHLISGHTRDHDVAVANKVLEWMPEKRMEWILGVLESEHGIWSNHMSMLDDLNFDLRLPSCRFIDLELDKKRQKLADSLKDTTQFVSKHFFPYGPSQGDRIYTALYPNLNIDREGTDYNNTRYNKFSEQLYELIKAVDFSYSDLVSAFHSRISYTSLAAANVEI